MQFKCKFHPPSIALHTYRHGDSVKLESFELPQYVPLLQGTLYGFPTLHGKKFWNSSIQHSIKAN